jgi:hypothetical protein
MINITSIYSLVNEYLHLPLRLVEPDHGITRESLDCFARNRKRIGDISYVYLLYPEGLDWNFWTVLVSPKGAWAFSGFAWGYGGEGPRGLISILEQIGFEIPKTFPPAHTAGLWRVDIDGNVCECNG